MAIAQSGRFRVTIDEQTYKENSFMSDWNGALQVVREQMADYEREGTSTPGKLKRSARLRAARMALRDFAASHPEPTARLKAFLNDVEKAEKDDDWRKISMLIPELLAAVDQVCQ